MVSSFQFVRTSLLGVKCEKPKFSEHLDGLPSFRAGPKMIRSMASYLKSWSERTAIDFAPINQSQPRNANSIYTAGSAAVSAAGQQARVRLFIAQDPLLRR